MSLNELFSLTSITQNPHSRSLSFDIAPPLYHIISVYNKGPGKWQPIRFGEMSTMLLIGKQPSKAPQDSSCLLHFHNLLLARAVPYMRMVELMPCTSTLHLQSAIADCKCNCRSRHLGPGISLILHWQLIFINYFYVYQFYFSIPKANFS